jgi:hypothetical protein
MQVGGVGWGQQFSIVGTQAPALHRWLRALQRFPAGFAGSASQLASPQVRPSGIHSQYPVGHCWQVPSHLSMQHRPGCPAQEPDWH